MNADSVILVEGLGKRYALGARSNERYVARGGRAMLFFSHSVTALPKLCQTGIYPAAGRVVRRTDIRSATDIYLGALANTVSGVSYNNRPCPESQRMYIPGFSIEGTDGDAIDAGQPDCPDRNAARAVVRHREHRPTDTTIAAAPPNERDGTAPS